MHVIMPCNTYAARAEVDLAAAELRWLLSVQRRRARAKMAGHDQRNDKTSKKDEDADARPTAAESKELVQSEDLNKDPEERLVWI